MTQYTINIEVKQYDNEPTYFLRRTVSAENYDEAVKIGRSMERYFKEFILHGVNEKP